LHCLSISQKDDSIAGVADTFQQKKMIGRCHVSIFFLFFTCSQQQDMKESTNNSNNNDNFVDTIDLLQSSEESSERDIAPSFNFFIDLYAESPRAKREQSKSKRKFRLSRVFSLRRNKREERQRSLSAETLAVDNNIYCSYHRRKWNIPPATKDIFKYERAEYYVCGCTIWLSHRQTPPELPS